MLTLGIFVTSRFHDIRPTLELWEVKALKNKLKGGSLKVPKVE